MAAPTDADRALSIADYRRFVELNAALDVVCADAERRSALHSILVRTEAALARPGPVIPRLPAIIGRAMGSFGWLWNGIYELWDDGKLHLGPAHGPPVCAELERRGGPLSSGMCFDALLLNQTLAAYDAKAWPGYVSCDAASGLRTVAGIVCPLRDRAGRPFAVWDLDATARIEPADVRFVDVLWSALPFVAGVELGTAAGPA